MPNANQKINAMNASWRRLRWEEPSPTGSAPESAWGPSLLGIPHSRKVALGGIGLLPESSGCHQLDYDLNVLPDVAAASRCGCCHAAERLFARTMTEKLRVIRSSIGT